MRRRPCLAFVALVLWAPAPGLVHAQTPSGPAAVLRLEDLERMALARNPTVAQTEAAVRAMEAQRRQAGRLPNPTLTYRGQRLTTDREKRIRQSEHAFLLEQPIVLGRKLKRNQAVMAAGTRVAEADAATQRQQVLNAVRLLYYEGLVAQRLVDVHRELSRLGREAVGITAQLLNVGQADRPDLLAAGIEADRMEVDLMAAEQEQEENRQVLAAVIGEPSLPPGPLEGTLEADIPDLDREALLAQVLRDSPEMKAAAARATWATAAVDRARADRIGNLALEAGADYDSDKSHGLGGWAAEVQLKIPLPLFDRRQGAIAAARAEADAAALEVRRVEMDLRARMAAEFRGYQVARGMAEKYRTSIIPQAEEAHRLYLERFREMAAAYPQVLIARRTLGEVRAEYVEALGSVWRHVGLIRGGLLLGSTADPSDAGLHSPSRPRPGMGLEEGSQP
jgi:cobalt-zinc-cadmium efflux system outer membrane protein